MSSNVDAGHAPAVPDPPREADQARRESTVEPGIVASVTGCAVHYRLYRPETSDTEDLVVLGHGFLRSQERMVDLARALANAGIPVVTLDYCNSRFWDGGHFRNGLDMIRVADDLGAAGVVYAGFSAGGLAALVAGRNDPRTIGVVALDLVDAKRLGETMASGLDRPLIGLLGDPSPCNAENSGLAVFSASDRASVEWVEGADHCDFESPSDWLCRILCQREQPKRGLPRRHIIAAATSAIEDLVASQSDAGPPETTPFRARSAGR